MGRTPPLWQRDERRRGDARSMVAAAPRPVAAGFPLYAARASPLAGLHHYRSADALTRHRREGGVVRRHRPADVKAISISPRSIDRPPRLLARVLPRKGGLG